MTIFESVIKKHSFTNLKKDEYIDENGIVKCSRCHTDRIVFINNVVVRCLCVCQEQQDNENWELEKKHREQFNLEQLKEMSMMGSRYKDVTFNSTTLGEEGREMFDKAFYRCQKYCEIHEEVLAKGQGIYIYGTQGSGKTHITACMANELMKKRKTVLFTNFFEISKHLQEIDYIKKLSRVDFLFIDDIGTERVQSTNGSDLQLQEKIFEVLNKRYIEKKPTIFTSNYSLKELINNRGVLPKTVDRIVEMSTVIMEINCPSYRKKNRLMHDINF